MQVPFNAAHTALAIANLMLAAYRRTETPSRDDKQTREMNGLLTNLFYTCIDVAYVRSDLFFFSVSCGRKIACGPQRSVLNSGSLAHM
jgi:hypothetical protein